MPSYAGAVDQRTVSAAYGDKRLAALYDALNPPGPETGFYLSLASDASPNGGRPARVLDMGCGTGRLACEFAARGYQVTGADPAAAMLGVARARPGGDRVRWIETDATHLAVPTRFDLIVLTGHVFQLLLDDRDVRAALRTLSQHLASGGRLAFETRNPAVREWQNWNPRQTTQRVEAGVLAAEVHYNIGGVSGELVTYETWFRFPDGDVVMVPDTLRFMDQVQVAGFLADAGRTEVTWYGDWDRSPASPASPEIIAVAG
jgi:SAM-dependent methyltransferase